MKGAALMCGLGWQELLIVLPLVVPVIVVIVAARRGKIVSVAADASSCVCTTHGLVDAGKEPAGG